MSYSEVKEFVKERTILSEGEVDLEIVYEDGQWAAELLAHAVEEGDDHGDVPLG